MAEQFNPYERLGGEASVRALATAFYDAMERDEPALTALHRCEAPGKVSAEARERFALFFIGWLGGPQTYIERFGHPRLRMRHAHVPVDEAMRDAWMRAMRSALTERGVDAELRTFLEPRLADLADFMRNKPG